MGRRNNQKHLQNGSGSGSKLLQPNTKFIQLKKPIHQQRQKLIDNIFALGSSFPQIKTPNSHWENHVQMNTIVDELTQLETNLKLPLPKREKNTVVELEKWAVENGVQLNKCKIVEFEGYEFGFVATNRINRNSIVTSVPKHMLITIDRIRGSPMQKLFDNDILMQQLPYVAIAIFLIVERFRTDKPSFWQPYFQALPTSYNTTLYFGIDELKELKGSPALDSALKMFKNIYRQYGYFWNLFQKGTDDASILLREVFTFEQYRWAVCTVMTRQNFIPCPDSSLTHAIIPVWDFFNHANNVDKSNTDTSTSYEDESQCCVCLAPRNFKKGQQVHIFYGQRSNADFLVYNGFVFPENHHDLVKVKLGLSVNDPLYDAKATVLRNLQLPPAGEYPIIKDKDTPIHSTTLAFVRIFKMNKDQLEECSKYDSEEIAVFEEPIGTKSNLFDDVVVLEYISARLDLLQTAYPTTLQEDEEMLKGGDISTFKKMAVLLRKSEKCILLSAYHFCCKRIYQLTLDSSKLI